MTFTMKPKATNTAIVVCQWPIIINCEQKGTGACPYFLRVSHSQSRNRALISRVGRIHPATARPSHTKVNSYPPAPADGSTRAEAIR